jgi:predicted ester cyclase
MGEADKVALRVIDAVNAHDLIALRKLYAADARTRRPGWPQEGDVEYLLASYELDFACVPDIRFEPLSSTSEGSRIATELRITGTNTGPTVLGDFGKALLGRDVEAVPPTGRPIDLPAVLVHEIVDGQVVAEGSIGGSSSFWCRSALSAAEAPRAGTAASRQERSVRS